MRTGRHRRVRALHRPDPAVLGPAAVLTSATASLGGSLTAAVARPHPVSAAALLGVCAGIGWLLGAGTELRRWWQERAA